jgi:hypothetical protein
MKTAKYEFLVKALSPIHHGGDEKTGSETMLRRMKFLVKDEVMDIPIISGNAVRGYLRRLLMEDFIYQVGYLEIHNYFLYHSLFSGGVLETREASEVGVLNLELRRKIRVFLPPVSLFGFAYKNQVVDGKMKVSHLLPCCEELTSYLPQAFLPLTSPSVFELLDFTFGTRKDEREMEGGENPVQMKYDYEVFCPGTVFYLRIDLMDTNEVEESCFGRMIELWRERPFIAGRSSAGEGRVEIVGEVPSSELYLTFLKERRNEIWEVMRELDR